MVGIRRLARLLGLASCIAACSADPAPTSNDAAAAEAGAGNGPGDGTDDTAGALAAGDSNSCADLAQRLLRTPATRAGLAAAYGAPDSLIAAVEPNRHIPGATDSLFTVFYPGLAATIRTPPSGRDLVTHVDVRDNRYVALGEIGIGVSADVLLERLGPPHSQDELSLTYECGVHVEEPVVFALDDDDVVAGIEIFHYVD